MPPLAAEGSDVLLLVRNVSENPLGYGWYRGERVENTQLIASYRVDTNATTNGPVYSRRETLYPNGTLLIRNVTQRDTGPYTLLVTKNDLWIETQTGHLHVHREYFLSDHGMFCRRGRGWSVAVEFCSHRTDSPGRSLHPPLHYVPGRGLNIQCRTHAVETNSKESEMLPGSQALQTVCREKDGLMEGLSRGTALSVQPPGPSL